MNGSSFLKNSRAENTRLKRRHVTSVVTLTASTTPANITATTDMPGALYAYVETSGQPTPVDSGATFGTLDSNAAPSTVGILFTGGDAKAHVSARATVISSASMTAGTFTKVGASSSGVTLSKNNALVMSCAGLDLDANANVHQVLVELWYDAE